MLKDTKSLGKNKAPACESRGFVLKKKVCFLTHLLNLHPPYSNTMALIIPIPFILFNNK